MPQLDESTTKDEYGRNINEEEESAWVFHTQRRIEEMNW